jgi:hypothetical protein
MSLARPVIIAVTVEGRRKSVVARDYRASRVRVQGWCTVSRPRARRRSRRDREDRIPIRGRSVLTRTRS